MRRYAALLGATAVLVVSVAGTKASAPVGAAPTVVIPVTASSDEQAAFAGDASAADSSGCFRALPGRSLRDLRDLPWPVVLTTGCGRFAAFPTGLLTRAPADPGQTPDPGYWVPAGGGSWVGVGGGHVGFIRGGKLPWRSAGGTLDVQKLGTAVHHGGWLGFSIYAAKEPTP